MSQRRPGPKAFAVSAAVHAVLLVPLVVLARPPEPVEFETIRLNLVSMPEPEAVEVESEAPAPPVDEPEPEPEPVPEEEAEPEVEVEEEPPPEPEREDIERPEPETPSPPREAEEVPEAPTGDDEMNIATEGREFPFPDYLANVITQVKRYFRWNEESRPRGLIYFEIEPDGDVRGIRMVRSSGNIAFDFAVQGAVETAGKRGAFGPLPDAYAGSFLPVQLEVEPPR